eukprot:COSAG06_NODE_153_length_21876_cov_5.100628_22_plen_189_part_00
MRCALLPNQALDSFRHCKSCPCQPCPCPCVGLAWRVSGLQPVSDANDRLFTFSRPAWCWLGTAIMHVLQAKQTLAAMSTAGLEPGIVAIGAVLNAAKNAATPSPEGTEIVQEAWGLFNELPREQRNGFVYSSMIAALGRASMKHEAVELFEEAASHLKPWCACSSIVFTDRQWFSLAPACPRASLSRL